MSEQKLPEDDVARPFGIPWGESEMLVIVYALFVKQQHTRFI